MYKFINFFILLSLITACSQAAVREEAETQKKVMHEESIPGGWSNAEINQDILDASDFAVKNIENDSPFRILSAKQQVVAGMNYALILEMQSGNKWEAVVYKDLGGKLLLIKLKQIK